MNFRHTCLIVTNVEKALWFYRDLLGMKVWKDVTLEGKYPETILGIIEVKVRYIKMDFEDYDPNKIPRFELHYYENPQVEIDELFPCGHISFTVDNLDELYKKLKDNDIIFISEPYICPDNPVKLCFCVDPFMNNIELVEDLK